MNISIRPKVLSPSAGNPLYLLRNSIFEIHKHSERTVKLDAKNQLKRVQSPAIMTLTDYQYIYVKRRWAVLI